VALALAREGVAVAVVEGAAAAAESHASFDARSVAVTDHARRVFTDLGVWPDIAPAAEAIRAIHISERGAFGMTHLSCADAGADALGYVVPSRAVGRALHRRLRAADAIDFYCPARARRVRPGEATVEVTVVADGAESTVTDDAQSTVTLTAPLVVLADGGRSNLAAQAGLPPAAASDYRQAAIVCAVATDRAHRGRAFERFTAEGPLALLPYRAPGAPAGRGYAVVWSTDARRAGARMALDDEEFTAQLQAAFGARAGNFSQPSPRAQYPLHFCLAPSPVGARAVGIGNAAHRLHPVAAQGLNLGLRDAVALAEVVGRAARAGGDVGGAEALARYAAMRRRETARVGAFTDGLIRAFASRAPAVKLARNLGLVGVEFCPPAKRFLLRRTMGRAAMAGLTGARF